MIDLSTFSDLKCVDYNGDGLLDGTEVNGWDLSFKWADSTVSYTHVTSSPTKINSDTDELSDYWEWKMLSNPKNPDTDYDGLLDHWEIEILTWSNSYYFFENIDQDKDGFPNIRDWDSDDDDISDGNEVFIYHADPWGGDADGDGLTDDIEEAGHPIMINGEYIWVYSDPGLVDTDDDGLWNGATGNCFGDDLDEYHWNTNPDNFDTDGDTVEDVLEIKGYATDAVSYVPVDFFNEEDFDDYTTKFDMNIWFEKGILALELVFRQFSF